MLPKFFPATAGDIDCNLSLFHLQKDDKKAADIFSITDLKVSIKFLFLLHKTPPICIRRQKNPCDFGCLYRLVLRTDFNPDYLIFSRFYLKNRPTTKPTPKSLFLTISTPVAVVAIFLAALWQTTVIILSESTKGNREIGQHLHARQRLFLRRNA